MLPIQQQYNQVPNQYAKEMRSVSVLPHLKSIVTDIVADLGKVISLSRVRK